MSYYCDSCDRWFNSHHAITQHYINSSFHSYCRWCDEHFYDDDELDDHYEEDHYWCGKCRLAFANEYGLSEHYRQSSNHHYCVDCKRDFSSDNNLKNHFRSSIHRPRAIRCTGKGCNQTFVSPAAMLLHLEAGYCVSGINRKYVNDKVREIDTDNIITNPSRLLTGPDTVTYIATNRAWNGYSYECYLCHNTYRTLAALNQHLASPRHQEKIYSCPLTTCRKKFNALSGLCQHIESEQCGVHKFKVVRNAIDGVVGQMRLLTVN